VDNRRFIAIAVPALLFIATGVVAIALLGHGTTEPLGSALAIGTLSSLVAAMIISAVRVIVAVRPQPSPNESHVAGLVRVTSKKAITSKEWLQVLQTAKSEFYVAGHSLGKWCSASNCDEFKSHVRRILDGNGRVTLVMLDPASPQIARLQLATAVDYTSRIHTSLRVLADLCGELQPAARARLKVSVLKDHPTLPYMVVGNEQRLVTATYLGSTDSDDVACLELELSSDAAAAVYDDFHKLAEAGAAAPLPPSTKESGANRRPVRRSWRSLFGRASKRGAEQRRALSGRRSPEGPY
jgi:hypothetical protein